jgi:lipoprotein-anchoring transpeptidase ErfK/SrfK
LSQPVIRAGALEQRFEGGTLVQVDRDEPYLAPIAHELLAGMGIDTTPVDQGDLPRFDESLFAVHGIPNQIGDPAAPGRRWLEVSVTDQQIWAYQGQSALMTSLVSTGKKPNQTTTGVFHVRLKYPKQDMRGFTGDSGEVIGFGDRAPERGALAYDVEDIPDVMYFSLNAEALHGTYWHSNFGTPMSHGCVNLPLDVSAWMYGWAPLGTMIWVHDLPPAERAAMSAEAVWAVTAGIGTM